MDSIDRLLAQVKAEYETANQQPQAKPLQTEQIKQPPPKSAASIDSLLAEVKADYKQHDWVEAQLRQQQQQAEVLKQQQHQQQQLQALQQRAIAWLEALDPFSSEGLWFERFAEKYSSKLEAAIDYLKDIAETDLG